MKSTPFALVVAAVMAIAFVAGGIASDAVPAAKGDLTFEIFKDGKKEYRWRIRAGNGRIIGMSDEGYDRKEGCRHAITLIKEGAASAKVEDLSTETK
jgi:uncharacterized protein